MHGRRRSRGGVADVKFSDERGESGIGAAGIDRRGVAA